MPARLNAKRRLAITFLILNTLVWGAALPIVKPALDVVSPFAYLFWRFLLAGLLTLPLLGWYLWRQRALWRHIGTIVVLELLGTTITLGLLYAGLARTSALEASLIVTTSPLFVTLGGILFLREKEERREWIGLTIAFGGTLLITLEPLLRGLADISDLSVLGNTLVFLQNVAQTAYFLLAKRRYHRLPKLFVAAMSFWVGAVSFGLICLLQGNLYTSALPTPSVAFAVGYMAIFGSIIGLTAYIAAQDRIEASEASLFTYLQPLVYVPLTMWWFGSRLTWPLLAGGILVFLGVTVAEQRRTRKKNVISPKPH